MPEHWKPVTASLKESVFKSRQAVNRKYMESLDCRRLMANYYAEAGLTSNNHMENWSIHYGGWEEPEMQVRGSFTGHYLSALSAYSAAEGDGAFKARADFLVDELTRCGDEHLNGWCMSIPELYLDWIMKGKWVWAPQYMVHKTLMGLVDTYKYTGNEKALRVADRAATLLYNRVRDYSRDEQDRMLNWETGGLMETFADLYGITGDAKYRVLMERYCRLALFDRLLAGEDALTYAHANTTIPEAHGCARAYEVTGDEKFRRMAEAFWRCGVEGRGAFATGGQNSHELWLKDFSGRDSARNQEFCTVYNLIRLADYLLRWTGEAKYADYIERALYNGVLAQQHRETGANTYFLPLGAGSKKAWGDRYNAMYCCYGTTVQAQSQYGYWALYSRAGEIMLSQYIPCHAAVGSAELTLTEDFALEVTNDPTTKSYTLRVAQREPSRFALKLRKPGLAEGFAVTVDGVPVDTTAGEGFVTIDRLWGTDTTVSIRFRWPLHAEVLSPDDGRYALMAGPVVLAGLTDVERTLPGDLNEPSNMLRAAGTLNHCGFAREWFTKGLDVNVRFTPLYEIADETYTVYFPFKQ